MYRILLAALAVVVLPAVGRAAAPDGNVEWNGVNHVAWQDRRPLCPVGGETFEVRFQTYQNDITSARVHVDDGAVTWANATPVGTRGPYDVWAAQIPATAAASESYWIELTDGADVDYYSVSGMSDGVPADGGFALDFTTLEHAPVGATLTDNGGAVFKVWAPTRVSTYVGGQFNSWNFGANPLTKVGEHFVGFIPNVSRRQQYKYLFNNTHYETDARARAINPSDNRNAYVEDPFYYAWQVADYPTPPFDQMVIYQLHVGTFAGRNDPLGGTPFPSRYVDVAARAGQLEELGINAVMLNPITEFPGDLSAGYNPQTMWAPEWKYGTPDQCKAMIDSLHAHGIAVLLDIVWNHFTTNDNFMWYYDGSQIYFDDPAVDTPWGSQADFDKAAVRDYYVESALHWLEEYHVDGFRMDATDYMNQGQPASGWALMQRLNDEVDNRWANKLVLAEQLPDDAGITTPTSSGGAGFDSQYHDAFVDGLRQAVFDAAFGDPNMAWVRSIILGSAPYLSGSRVVNYLELHDEAWPTSGGQRIVKTIDPTAPHDNLYAKGRVKLAQGLVMTAPGIPAILMGTEWLEDTDFGAESGNRIDWSKRTTYAPIYQYFQDLIGLRLGRPELFASASVHVYHVNEGGNVLAFRRYDAQGNLAVVIANFSNTNYSDYRLGLPASGPWHELIDSQSSVYDGNGLDNPGTFYTDAISADGFVQSAALSVPQMGLIVLAPGISLVGAGEQPRSTPGALRIQRIAPSPARGSATLTFSLPRAATVRLALYDARGARVATLLDGELSAGVHSARWNGLDARGSRAPAGIYFARIEAGGEAATLRFVLLR